MVLTEEEKKNLRILALLFIFGGLAINIYLLTSEGKETTATSTLTQSALSSLRG